MRRRRHRRRPGGCGGPRSSRRGSDDACRRTGRQGQQRQHGNSGAPDGAAGLPVSGSPPGRPSLALPAAAHVAVPLGRTGSATSFGARVFPAPAGMRSGCGRRNHPGLCSRAPGGVPALRRAVICLSPVSPHSARVPITGARMSRTGARPISIRQPMEIIRVSMISTRAPMGTIRALTISGDARPPVTHAPVISIAHAWK